MNNGEMNCRVEAALDRSRKWFINNSQQMMEELGSAVQDPEFSIQIHTPFAETIQIFHVMSGLSKDNNLMMSHYDFLFSPNLLKFYVEIIFKHPKSLRLVARIILVTSMYSGNFADAPVVNLCLEQIQDSLKSDAEPSWLEELDLDCIEYMVSGIRIDVKKYEFEIERLLGRVLSRGNGVSREELYFLTHVIMFTSDYGSLSCDSLTSHHANMREAMELANLVARQDGNIDLLSEVSVALSLMGTASENTESIEYILDGQLEDGSFPIFRPLQNAAKISTQNFRNGYHPTLACMWALHLFCQTGVPERREKRNIPKIGAAWACSAELAGIIYDRSKGTQAKASLDDQYSMACSLSWAHSQNWFLNMGIDAHTLTPKRLTLLHSYALRSERLLNIISGHFEIDISDLRASLSKIRDARAGMSAEKDTACNSNAYCSVVDVSACVSQNLLLHGQVSEHKILTELDISAQNGDNDLFLSLCELALIYCGKEKEAPSQNVRQYGRRQAYYLHSFGAGEGSSNYEIVDQLHILDCLSLVSEIMNFGNSSGN